MISDAYLVKLLKLKSRCSKVLLDWRQLEMAWAAKLSPSSPSWLKL